MKIYLYLCWALLLAACSNNQAHSLPVVPLYVGDQRIEVELALTPEQQAKGLMHRQAMAEMNGMLFSFERDKILRFYMKDTLIPLSIAYLDKDGVIREIYDMQPQDERIVASQWPMRFALEMNQGWFERHKVYPGQRVTLEGQQPLQQAILQKITAASN